MKKHYNYLDIDLDSSKIYRRLSAMQGDIKSRYILVNLYSNNLAYDLTNCNVKIYGIKKDTTVFFNNAVIIDALKGQFEIELTNQALAVSGELKIQILILGATGEKLTSSVFFINVGESIVDENAIESTNEFNALTEGLAGLVEYDMYKQNVSAHEEKLIQHDAQFNTKANITDTFLKQNGININDLDEVTRKAILENNSIDINYVLGADNVKSINILDKSVGYEKTTFFNIEKSINVLDKNKLLDGYTVNENGVLTVNANSMLSDFIKVKPGDIIRFQNDWLGAFYNEYKEFIQSKPFGTNQATIPVNAVYYRHSVTKSLKDTFMITINNEIPSSYIPFSEVTNITNDFKAILLNSIYENIIHYSLKGKKWCVVGDSLTEKNIRATKNYHDYVAEETGCTVVNMGVGGTGYKRMESQSDGYKAFYQRIVDVPNDTDILTIFGSGNDLSLTLGSPTDDITSGTVCGCMNETFKRLFTRLPGIKVGVVLPCPWGSYPPYVQGNAMELYCKALKEICKNYSIPVLDLYYGSNMRPWDNTFRQLYYKRDDGNFVHPDEDGHKILANKFKMFIQSL